MAHNGQNRSWWLLAGLLITAFLARGPLYLSVFPPFEGWDEYQHLGYIAYLDQARRVPVFDERTRVPRAIRPLAVAMPHSASGAEQLREWGAMAYAEYWNAPAPAGATPRQAFSSPRLYQAQQPPLAYLLALPLWRALQSAHPLDAIYAIRAMNLLLVAGALVLFAGALIRLVPAFGPRAAVFALVCLHPLFLQNVARVANDGLAVATGLAGISLLILADARTVFTRGLLATVCIAASVWSKQTSLTLIPALFLGLPLIGWAHGVSARRLWRVTGLAAFVFVLLVAPLWLWSYQHYGTLLTTQDSVELAARGSTFSAVTASITSMPWGTAFEFLFFPGRAWVGGWTFLSVQEPLGGLYSWYWRILLIAAAVGAMVAFFRRVRPAEPAGLAVCAAVAICTALGMTYHAVLSHAVYGRVMTTPWYFMTALPFLFVLVVRGLEMIDRRLPVGAGAMLAVLLVAIDLHGTWIQMPTAYANTTDIALQWNRLTSIHPSFLSGTLRWWFLATQLGSLCLVVVGVVRTSRQRATTQARLGAT